MDYNTEEQEIDLKDLMFAVFHKWRPLILVAVICGLLLGGVKGFMTYKHNFVFFIHLFHSLSQISK